jgi:hypothetical protein
MSDIETGATEVAPDAGTVESATPSEVVKDNSWESIDRTMDETWAKLNPERGDNGQFKGDEKPAPAEDAKPESTDQTQAKVAEPSSTAIEAPASWSAEKKALWPSLSPDAQSYIAQREGEAHKRISELGQTVKATEPIRQVIDHYKSDFQARQMDPARGIAALMEVQRMLDTDFVAGINAVAEAYGKPSPFASRPAESEGNESNPQVRSLETKIANLEKQLGQTREHVMADIRDKQSRESANLASLVDDFSKDKTDFSEIESDVVAQIHAIRSAEPGLDSKALLAKAYENARWANPSTRAKMQEAERKADETRRAEETRKKAEEAKKASRLNVKSSNGASPARKGSWEDTLAATADRIFSQ